METGEGLTFSFQDGRVEDKGEKKKRGKPRRTCGVCKGCKGKQRCTNPKH